MKENYLQKFNKFYNQHSHGHTIVKKVYISFMQTIQPKEMIVNQIVHNKKLRKTFITYSMASMLIIFVSKNKFILLTVHP